MLHCCVPAVKLNDRVNKFCRAQWIIDDNQISLNNLQPQEISKFIWQVDRHIQPYIVYLKNHLKKGQKSQLNPATAAAWPGEKLGMIQLFYARHCSNETGHEPPTIEAVRPGKDLTGWYLGDDFRSRRSRRFVFLPSRAPRFQNYLIFGLPNPTAKPFYASNLVDCETTDNNKSQRLAAATSFQLLPLKTSPPS